jgi:DNA adenine methylase
MILRRLGNKSKIASEIYRHFPPHRTYVEPFFGAGGMFFNKPKAKYNILND